MTIYCGLREGSLPVEKTEEFWVQETGCRLSANSGWLGLSEAKPRSSRRRTKRGVVPMRSGLRHSHSEEGEDSTRRATEGHGEKSGFRVQVSGFRFQKWEPAAFPNPEPLCLPRGCDVGFDKKQLAAPALAEAAKEEKEERRKNEVGKWCYLLWSAAGRAPNRNGTASIDGRLTKPPPRVKYNNSRFKQRPSFAGWKSGGFRGSGSRASVLI